MASQAAIGVKALVTNPALTALAFLIGPWETFGTHPLMPGKLLRGKTSFSWHEGGAFVVMHSEIEEQGFPNGVAIFGSDDSKNKFVMTYFDERGTSRIYEVKTGDHQLSWRREDPKISQTNIIKADVDGETLISHGRISENGGDWVEDLSLTYKRMKSQLPASNA